MRFSLPFSPLSSAIVLVSSIPLVAARIYDGFRALPKDAQYDFIVVGAGTAGSLVASRLSENLNIRVLVIEAGGMNNGSAAIDLQVPFMVSAAAPNTPFDWNMTTVEQPSLKGRTLQYPRGLGVGGSSSINFMAFTRGSSDEYDRMAKVTGESNWSWRQMVPYLMKNERHVESADGHNTAGQYDPSWHGTGQVMTSLPGFPADTDSRIMATTKSSLKSIFPFNKEMNNGNPIGVGWLQSTIGDGQRSSSATAFMQPTLVRKYVDLVINTRVTRLVQTGFGRSSKPEFLGVELGQPGSQNRRTIIAKREVIMSAGAINTPQILMLSGIGDPTALRAVGITPKVSLSAVGQALQDHPYMTIQWEVNSKGTFDTIVHDPTKFAAALDEWQHAKKGIMANNAIANHIAMLRVQNSTFNRTYGDPSAGGKTPHFEIAFCGGYVGTTQIPPTTGNYVSAALVVLTPTTRGSVTLRSSDPFDMPLINPGFLSTDSDMAIMVEAVKTAKRFFSASPWAGYIKGLSKDSANTTTDAQIVNYAREYTASIRHPVSTARVIDVKTGHGVVDSDLLVSQVAGLRIIDASVLPYVPAAHPLAMIYGVAERGADLVKATHGI